MDEKNEIFLRVFALCEYVLVDQQNRYSLIGIYDKIFLVDTPAEFPIEMVLVISSDKKENDISVSIENPSGIIDEISKIKSKVEEELITIRANGLYKISGFGKHYVNISVNNKIISRHFFTVDKIDR